MEILFAIEDLKAFETKGASQPQLSSAIRSDKYDVFISYRRVGGAGGYSIIVIFSHLIVFVHVPLIFFADFAQLLKILLKAQGLEVFLDVDNLANTGAFDDQLWKHLSATKNVVLVWTKGCMDRFLGEEDIGQQDFVRKE
jgi:hypothetical protein